MKKIRNKKKICRFCKQIFFAADNKASVCNSCAKEKSICLGCQGKKIVSSKLCVKCSGKKFKNKSKQEIISIYPKWENCGFKKGDKNSAKNPEVRTKISQAVTNSYIKNPKLRLLRAINVRNFLQGKYDDNMGNKLKSKLELGVARYLQKNKILYEYEKQIITPKGIFYPDFFISSDILIEVCGWILNNKDLKRYLSRIHYFLKYTDYQIIILTYKEYVRNFDELQKIRPFDVISLTNNNLSLKELFIEKVMNIDYTHTLPFHIEKCKNIHSHTSYDIGINIEGYENKITGMVLDYKIIKDITKKVISKYDHKILIDRKYVSKETGKNYQFDYDTTEGHYFLDIPKTNIILLSNEATLETISSKIIDELNKEFPVNIVSFTLVMKEGTGGGCITRFYRDDSNYYLKDLEKIIKFHKMIKL